RTTSRDVRRNDNAIFIDQVVLHELRRNINAAKTNIPACFLLQPQYFFLRVSADNSLIGPLRLRQRPSEDDDLADGSEPLSEGLVSRARPRTALRHVRPI